VAEVVLENLCKAFPDGTVAVDDFNLHINDEEFVVLVGPSGCGKSTTLRVVAGLEEATSGSVSIGGEVVNEVAPRDRDIAMVFQNYALYPHMTVYKNMAFGLKMRKCKKEEIERRVREAARILNIEELLERKPAALSGGQRQRVAMGRAIVRQPQVFLFDEPLSNLDARLRVEMRAELKRLHNTLRTTTIYVTHDQEEAMTLGERIVVMKDGRLQQVGKPLQIYNHPVNRFVAGFVGTPPMNFFSGEVVSENEQLFFVDRVVKLALQEHNTEALREWEGQEVLLGVRPQAMSLGGQGSALPVRVDVIEPLGDKVDIYVSTPKHPHIVARVDAGIKTQLGEDIELHIDMSKTHLFEPGTQGRNLSLRGTE
jgi:multiple sugar transport system ATP-binding protein